jgi:transposase
VRRTADAVNSIRLKPGSYYCIVTNLFDEDKSGKFKDEKIIDMYRGLWRIEDSFRVTKSEDPFTSRDMSA